MGRKNNVNPDHYKTAGREKPGQDIVQEIHKQKFTQEQEQARKKTVGSTFISGGESDLSGSSARDAKNDAGQVNESANSSSNT